MRYGAREEVSITTIVVRRPAGSGEAAQDHRRLSRAVVSGLAMRDSTWIRGVYLGLALLCLAGAATLLHLAAK